MMRKLKMKPEATIYDISKIFLINNCFLSETMKARNCERNIIKGELGRKHNTKTINPTKILYLILIKCLL